MAKKLEAAEEQKEVKTRPFVGIDKQNGRWGIATLQVVEGTSEVVSRKFEPSVDNYKSGAILDLESTLTKSGMLHLED